MHSYSNNVFNLWRHTSDFVEADGQSPSFNFPTLLGAGLLMSLQVIFVGGGGAGHYMEGLGNS